jgi:hypothetical protein
MGRLVLAMMAFAAMLCAAPAAAAVAGQCHVELYSPADRATPPAEDPGDQWSCREVEPEPIRAHQVPICLIEGASAVAPLPILPTDGARAESADPPTPDQWMPGSHESRHKSPMDVGDAMLSAPELPMPERAVERITSPSTHGAERASRAPGVYRPPKG